MLLSEKEYESCLLVVSLTSVGKRSIIGRSCVQIQLLIMWG